ncbi:transcriptional regulatory repressor protein (Tetr-family) Ethr [Mycobacteroides abscessus subsp. bolletii]|uniref:TetR/AcrR family transcriptional regulator n=1 Tax=Mycobacteroides abscessus TaxID=36809 RepID=UPI0009A79365|nr:TetR/AcrR family transcriptional regulator [Mycobacteroides abscessus]SKG69095.1 transcriptional regulatory repressor protein (Tetr-family) Ethr [Mycobacteroides abscessus subsp. bolletii]SKH12847.1 transcriptional regulatory repressor protein (Tetr-family) Ethr [Mycobacteroides abscessus subsp. bolletii]
MSTEPSPVPRALQARSRITFDKLFAAGTRLLKEGGPEALTVAAVAESAGLSVGSVYRRFGDKERMLMAIQARFTSEFCDEFRTRVADTGLSAATPPAEVIGSAVMGSAETFRAHGPLLRVFMLMGASYPAVFDHGSAASVEFGRTFRNTVILAAPAIRHHPDVEAAIDFAYRLTYAACAHRIIHGENLESRRALPWREFIDQLRGAVTAYLLSPPDGT